jgi:uncharacterized membrane protein
MSAAAVAQAPGASMSNSVAGMLCYSLGLITGIIFLVIEPYKNIRFVRFHAIQSILYFVVCCVFSAMWRVIIINIFFSGGLHSFWTFGWLYSFIRLLMFVGWIFLMLKAYGNEEFRLPILGDLAAQQAGS